MSNEFDMEAYLHPEVFEKTRKVGVIVTHLKGVLEDPTYSADYKKAAEEIAKETLDDVMNKKI